MEQYYEPSGRYSPLSFLLWILIAFTALPLLAMVYAYAIWYIPIPYLNFFITGIFGFSIGWIVSNVVVKYGKVRNKMLASVFGLFAALTALYFHWAVWVDLAFNVSDTIGTDSIGIATSNIKFGEVLGLAANPSGLFDTMRLINEVGVWGIKGGTVSGTLLSIVWIIEMIVVVFVTYLFSSGQATKPFCETEDNWFKEMELSKVGYVEETQKLLDSLSNGDIATLETMLVPAHKSKSKHRTKFTLFDANSGENFITVETEVASIDNDGSTKYSSQYETINRKIPQSVATRLRQGFS